MWCLWLVVLCVSSRVGAKGDPVALGRPGAHGLYGGPGAGGFTFYRALRRTGAGTRRMFGGAPAREWTPACALVDRSLVALCSGTVLAPRWALTAAHCVRPGVGYVRYHGRSSDDDLAAVHRLYAHPEYRVKHADEGSGMDVVLLHHDVGLVHTSSDMTLAVAVLAARPLAARGEPSAPEEYDPMKAMTEFSVDSLLGQEVEMMGFGRTDRAGAGAGAVLRAARLRVAACQRGEREWRHCACALGNASGVCSGDSGGPVIYQGKQVGVTSMGPLLCAAVPGPDGGPSAPALSVFTALKPYAALINATMHGTERTGRMSLVPARAPPPAPLGVLLAAAPALLCATY